MVIEQQNLLRPSNALMCLVHVHINTFNIHWCHLSASVVTNKITIFTF